MTTRPHADELIPFMPATVREEYFAHDPEVEGFTPTVKAWIMQSKIPFVEKWVERLRKWSADQLGIALREQGKMNDAARELYGNENGAIRHRAVIHPVIKRHMEIQHGRTIFHDPAALADTAKRAPKIFLQ